MKISSACMHVGCNVSFLCILLRYGYISDGCSSGLFYKPSTYLSCEKIMDLTILGDVSSSMCKIVTVTLLFRAKPGWI